MRTFSIHSETGSVYYLLLTGIPPSRKLGFQSKRVPRKLPSKSKIMV